jgi:hypothetical protein
MSSCLLLMFGRAGGHSQISIAGRNPETFNLTDYGDTKQSY